MITDGLVTVKQLADNLGITKNRVAYQVRKVSNDNIQLVDGVQYLNKQAQEQVINAINQLNSAESIDDKQQSTVEQSADNDAVHLLNQRIKSLETLTEALQVQLEKLDKQLSAKDAQINQLHTIIATQAQQAGVKQLANNDAKRSFFWQRLFNK